ncbi:MAG: helix-turn-helix transcriptional regulator [Nanoarchaeota archaeon]
MTEKLPKMSEKLLHLRDIKTKTQKEVAEAIGITRIALSKIEKGENIPSAKTIIKLAKYYNVSTDYLLFDDIKKLQIEEETNVLQDVFFAISKIKKRQNNIKFIRRSIEICKETIKKYTGSKSLWSEVYPLFSYILSDIYRRVNDKEALQIIEGTIKIHKDPRYQIQRAIIIYRSGKLKEAEKSLRSIIISIEDKLNRPSCKPGQQENLLVSLSTGYRYLAELLLDKYEKTLKSELIEEVDGILKIGNKILKKLPSNNLTVNATESLLQLTFCRRLFMLSYKKKNFRITAINTIELLIKYWKSKKDNSYYFSDYYLSRAYMLIGDAWASEGELKKAKSYYHRAIRKDPYGPVGLVYRRLREKDEFKDLKPIAFFQKNFKNVLTLG